MKRSSSSSSSSRSGVYSLRRTIINIPDIRKLSSLRLTCGQCASKTPSYNGFALPHKCGGQDADHSRQRPSSVRATSRQWSGAGPGPRPVSQEQRHTRSNMANLNGTPHFVLAERALLCVSSVSGVVWCYHLPCAISWCRPCFSSLGLITSLDVLPTRPRDLAVGIEQ